MLGKCPAQGPVTRASRKLDARIERSWAQLSASQRMGQQPEDDPDCEMCVNITTLLQQYGPEFDPAQAEAMLDGLCDKLPDDPEYEVRPCCVPSCPTTPSTRRPCFLAICSALQFRNLAIT